MFRDKTEYNIIIVEDNIGDFILLKDYLDDVMTNTHIVHFQLFKDFEDYFVSHLNVTLLGIIAYRILQGNLESAASTYPMICQPLYGEQY
jgi:hypothetical protein